MWVGTMVLTPLDSIAGLKEPEAVWPFTTGSVSTISKVARWGISIEMGRPSNICSCTSMFSVR